MEILESVDCVPVLATAYQKHQQEKALLQQILITQSCIMSWLYRLEEEVRQQPAQ